MTKDIHCLPKASVCGRLQSGSRPEWPSGQDRQLVALIAATAEGWSCIPRTDNLTWFGAPNGRRAPVS